MPAVQLPSPSIYGILISVAIISCLFVIEKLLPKEDRNTLWAISFWVIVGGIIGARLYHVIHYYNYYIQDPIKVFYLRNGGLGIWGGLIGGGISAITILKLKHENILKWFDVISVSLPLGQAIGRFGNFFNKEIYGSPTTLPWGIYIEPDKRPLNMENFATYHPLFFYESLLNLILFTVLMFLYKKQTNQKPGFFLGIYLAGYGAIRFALDFLRIDPWTIDRLNVSQVISILSVLIGLFLAYERKTQTHSN